jgi:hypothetical protein
VTNSEVLTGGTVATLYFEVMFVKLSGAYKVLPILQTHSQKLSQVADPFGTTRGFNVGIFTNNK